MQTKKTLIPILMLFIALSLSAQTHNVRRGSTSSTTRKNTSTTREKKPKPRTEPSSSMSSAKHLPTPNSSLSSASIPISEGCPDENHPHKIDLALPSGTKWACCNVGTAYPNGYGGYYAWGETEEKKKFDISNYIHCDGSWNNYHYLGDNISGTQYDVAHVKWAGFWKMPSIDQFKELLDHCTHKVSSINEVRGMLFTSKKNNNSIFLPFTGYYSDYLLTKDSDGVYWTGTHNNGKGIFEGAYVIMIDRDGETKWLDDFGTRYYGFSVRPISE